MTDFLHSLHPNFGGEPTIHQSGSVYYIGTNRHDSTYHTAVNSFVSHRDKQPGLHSAVLERILKETVGAGLFQKSGIVANNGMHSHCETLASNTRIYSLGDVISRYLLAARTFCTGCCGRFLGGETCHTMFMRVAGKCCDNFSEIMQPLYSEEYLCIPDECDIKDITNLHEKVHGVQGMLGSLDCMHTGWKNCAFGNC